MEKEYAGWRKMYTNSERKQFSRWKSAINLMTEEIAVHGRKTALKELDAVFTAVSPFVLVLKQRKKDRAKKSPAMLEIPANEIPANDIADV